VLSLMKSWWSCPTRVENMAQEMTVKFCEAHKAFLTIGHIVVVAVVCKHT